MPAGGVGADVLPLFERRPIKDHGHAVVNLGYEGVRLGMTIAQDRPSLASSVPSNDDASGGENS
jgi:hypothetical protein